VDVRGFEPLTPCLQSREEKTLTCFDGVAYTENQQNSRSPVVPKLYRVLSPATLLENEPLMNVPVSPRRTREAEGGGLLILPARFVLTDFVSCFALATPQLQSDALICNV